MVFDKLQSINRKTAAVCVAALLTGFIAGAGYAWSSNKTSPHYNTAKLTSELHYAKVETGRLQCVVLQDKAAMYSAPSGLHGKVIDYLSAGVKLDYIDTVSSQDKDERYAVTEQQLQFRKFFGRRHQDFQTMLTGYRQVPVLIHPYLHTVNHFCFRLLPLPGSECNHSQHIK